MTVQQLILIGGGGHAKVLVALARAAGLHVAGVCDPRLAASGLAEWQGIRVLGGDEALAQLNPAAVGLVNGIGQVPFSSLRERVFTRCSAQGFRFPPLVHPSAWVAPDVVLGEGVQVMAGAIVQPATRLGINMVINSGATVDHDCDVGAHVHVAPGAVLCGAVEVQVNAFIGAGATVIQGVRIGSYAVVGAGVTVVRDVADGAVLLGAKGSIRSAP